MHRLLIHVEGQTEESFVNEILAEHLYRQGYASVSARLVGNARLRENRGGIRAWSSVKKDILNHLKEDTQCIATTMVDYYGLPHASEKAWPGRAEAGSLPFEQKATFIENAIFEDMSRELGGNYEARRFIPFVVMHEFEGLLFSDCHSFANGIGKPRLEPDFHSIREQFTTPEEINDSQVTAPSKRVAGLFPEYEKPLHGILAALGMGLQIIREECPHFNDWLTRLEQLPESYARDTL